MRQVINWNTKWAFSKEAVKAPEEMPKNWYFVNLPHTWNAIDGQDGDNDYYRGICYYAKKLSRDELPEAEEYYLEINGANSSATVHLNGKELAHHDGGYSTWRIRLTDALQKENLIVIAVDNSANDRVYPQNADFTFYGGLYREVNLIAVSRSHFDLMYYGGPGIKVTPMVKDPVPEVQLSKAQITEDRMPKDPIPEDQVVEALMVQNQTAENRAATGREAEIEIEVYLKNAKEGQKLHYRIIDREGSIVAEEVKEVSDTKIRLRIEKVHLWQGRQDPYLYTAEVVLKEGENCLDKVETRFGCRSFSIDPEKGFFLNGQAYPLHGVSRHQDRWGIGNALLKEHHKEDMDLICEMGANTIRLAHYQHDQYFYDLCDERGMVVWAEIPYISAHMQQGKENTITQMKELIVQNYNHPSIVVWGLSNEITMAGAENEELLENHVILNELAHEMDPTRLTTLAAVSMCDIHSTYLQIPDVISYNHYFGWYGGDTSMNGPWFDAFHKEFPHIPIGMSEYGCEALNWHTSDPVQGDYTEEYQAYYHEELIRQLFVRPYIWATHVWNMFDFGADARGEGGENGQNHKGLVTFDRTYKKDSFYAYKAWLSDEAFVHICGKRYSDRVEDMTRVTVYSNLPEVELFRNGESLGKQKKEDHFFYFQVPNVGESVLEAVAMGEVHPFKENAGEKPSGSRKPIKICKDQSFLRKVEVFPDKYRLKEKGAVLNWFDITQPEGFYSLNDKVSEILKSKEGEALFGELMGMLTAKSDRNTLLKPQQTESMMEMMGGFTVLRLINLMGTAGNAEKLSKEQLLALNTRLNKIPRAI